MTQDRKYPAVTIAMPAKRCEVVSTLAGQRILALKAPRLPMADCTMPDQCRCRFQKYADRREDEQGRRFRFSQERGAGQTNGQRRTSRGRRSAD
jgi:hypothetical protein